MIMSKIGDLFGEYASTPFEKRKTKEVSALRRDFESKRKAPGHVTKNCSDCDSEQAWYSSDHGSTWQCHAHRREWV